MGKRKKAVSLFTGAGGMDIGFQRAGFDVVWANEIMPHAANTYKLNHPKAVVHCSSLNEVIDTLPDECDVDCVFGGPPCQGFSVAGKMNLDDERSQHVFSFMEVVKRLLPPVFVMENVKALATLSKFDQVRKELLRRAYRLGYEPEFYLLNAKDFGVPQSRERVFFIGFRNDLKIKFNGHFFSAYKCNAPTVRDVLSQIGPAGTESNPITCKAKITLAERPIMRKSPYAGMMFNGLGRPLNTDGVSCTLPASMGGNKTPIVDEAHIFGGKPAWVENYHSKLLAGNKPFGMYDAPATLRRLTLKEAVALQTFPADYKFSGPVSSQYTQIGNAVPCRLAFSVARAVMDALENRVLADLLEEKQLALV